MAETTNSGTQVTLPSDREIAFSRVFQAPRELVFEAWTKPEHVKNWYPCPQMSMSVCEIDLRPGGAWRYILATADGTEYRFRGIYQEVAAPERLVLTECFENPAVGNPEWLTTITFEEHDGRTTVKSTLLHKSVENRNGHLQSGMERGLSHTMDRLEEEVAAMERERAVGATQGA